MESNENPSRTLFGKNAMSASRAHQSERNPAYRRMGRLLTLGGHFLRCATLVGIVAILLNLVTIGASQACSTGEIASIMAAPAASAVSTPASNSGEFEARGLQQCNHRSHERRGSCCQAPCCSSCSVALVQSLPAASPQQLVARLSFPLQNRLSTTLPLPAFRPPKHYS